MALYATTAAAASNHKLSHIEQILASVAGYEFEVGPIVAGLLACFAVSFYVSKTEPEHKWKIDAPITFAALAFTAANIQSQRPIPLIALFYGTGAGAFGVGFIRVALSFVRKSLAAVGDDRHSPKP